MAARSPRAARGCRLGPARLSCGGLATNPGTETSPRPRTTAVRGIGDAPRPGNVASAPHGDCAGDWRQTWARERRPGPAQPLRGGFATNPGTGTSPRPRTADMRGIRDAPRPGNVVSAPRSCRAGVWRRFAVQRRRLGPARPPRGGFATPCRPETSPPRPFFSPAVMKNSCGRHLRKRDSSQVGCPRPRHPASGPSARLGDTRLTHS